MSIQEIVNEITKLNSIDLEEANSLGAGSFASVYGYRLNNYQVAIKCFQNKEKA